MDHEDVEMVTNSSRPVLRSRTVQDEKQEQCIVLDAKTKRLVDRLHRLKEMRSTLSGYEKLRDEILFETERISTHIATLAEVIKIVGESEGWDIGEIGKARSNSKWAEFMKIAKMVDSVESMDKKRKRIGSDSGHSEVRRTRNFATLAALWSPHLAKHYGWYSASQRQMQLLCTCAREYPNFSEDFVPLANIVLLARHRTSLVNNKVERIGEASRTAHKADMGLKFPLLFQDLRHLASLNAAGRVDVYGQQLTRSSVLDEEELTLWTTNEDGDIPVARSTLRRTRPLHYHQFLLEQDAYGLLQIRKSPTRRGPRSVANGRSKESSSSSGLFKPRAGEKPLGTRYMKDIGGAPVRRQANLLNDMGPGEGRNTTTPELPEFRSAASSHETRGPATRSSSISTLTELTSASPSPTTSSATHIRVLDPPVQQRNTLSIEETLHNRYSELISSYAKKLENECDQSDAHRVRAQWLTKRTSWANVWAPLECDLGVGLSSTEASAEVLYYSNGVFMDSLRQGKVFSKPVVIKEAFSDSGMNTVDSFRSLLRSAFHDREIDIHRLGTRQTESVSASEFLRHLHNGCGDNALNLRDLTKAHRPLFTMMPRFRLLESLTDNSHGKPGKDVGCRPVDVASCLSFNILGQRGAFSGAHIDSLAGTWVRNLDGLKFWMIVPSGEIDVDMEICFEGDSWLPDGKEKLIVLERDDILLMPPGLRQIHAVHSPVTCLMAGGMLWDDGCVLDTLESILWIGKHQQATNEAIAYELPEVIAALENLVSTDTARFCGQLSTDRFHRLFKDVLQRYRSLGCICGLQETATCPCYEGGRRCTSQCAGHPRLPPGSSQYACMHEGPHHTQAMSTRARGVQTCRHV